MKCEKTIVGYMDEVLDIRYDTRSNNERVVVATNSSALCVIELKSMNARCVCV